LLKDAGEAENGLSRLSFRYIAARYIAADYSPMTKSTKPTPEINLRDAQYYFNRELSWLEFNRRVLQEAIDPRTPFLERLKFLAIFSSNLDEFFMVRVAVLKDQVNVGVSRLTPDGRTPKQQLQEISDRIRPVITEQHQQFETVLRPAMRDHGIYLMDYAELDAKQRAYLQRLFEQKLFPVLTPLAVDPSHPFPMMANLSLNLAVIVKHPETGRLEFARVKVPDILPRFVPLPEELRHAKQKACVWAGVPLEQVMAHNLSALFPGMEIQECYPFRITRDADIAIAEHESDDLLMTIQQELRKRHFGGSVVRLEIQPSMSALVREMLMKGMEITEGEVYEIDGLLGLSDLMSFMGLPLPELKDSPWTPVIPPRLRQIHEPGISTNLEEHEDIFSIIRQKDLLVHHPYESFDASVERFVTQAAHDPDVLAIKMTLYRTSGDSPIIAALISAAENRKQVAALVELKARFDEENNIVWAQKLEDAGVHVIYGLIGLKTHTKIVLVVRKEYDEIRRYVHIGTGNYNPKTAKLYTDFGLLSCREDLGADLTDLFNYLTGYSLQRSYRKLLVSPVSMRDRMVAMIEREMAYCAEGKVGRIVAKMNSLVDQTIIAKLYEASRAGVDIDLIVRGICCLRPGLPEVSDRIRVISIIGRYLEHSRVFHFHNAGQDEFYIGSADWMPRNLDRRVEAVTPVEDPDLQAELKTVLEILLSDNRQAWDLQSDGSYVQRQPAEGEPERRSHDLLMERTLKIAEAI
jgi:polyphosphate kinase